MGGSRVEMIACTRCSRATQHVRNEPSHLLHLILSIVLCGWWLIVWALLCICQKNPQCMECGLNSGTAPASKILGYVLLLLFFALMCLFTFLFEGFIAALDAPQ